ncbi:MAG TPA: glycosyltransferase [Leptospiraceae bacterium]|nr:glycosyltransferase [Leptospiraceae bacterium]HMW04576.1 glycosyltransferase [Leptospiraceae bacterium]HMX33271.1 glycosyltransferase [Leptospiraceae bacterium]HMY30762.1 glycosyltransferase [Leptospiraceae bacterium]HMZ64340.1 glycosyltransferase [Leptospiraceae bacterium]
MRIFQHVDEFNERDGIGNDISGFDSIFKDLHLESNIICRINNSKQKTDIYSPEDKLVFSKNDVHILHYGGTGYPIDFFANLPGKKILRFHNITPAYFFKPYLDSSIYESFEKNESISLFELYSLRKNIHFLWSDSKFNQDEFFKFTGKTNKFIAEVLPVTHRYPLATAKSENNFTIGFVGRLVPNKKIEDLYFTLFYLKKINPKYRLILFGKRNQIFKKYFQKLDSIAEELNLLDSIELNENLDDANLRDKFSKLSVYVSMSEHEGFGVPLLEAMSLNIPVIAYSSTAVTELVENAGLLFSTKDFPKIAELIDTLHSNPNIKDRLLQMQKKRIQIISNFSYKEKIQNLIKI